MSILQEYEKIKSQLRKGEFNAMERYLAIHPELFLSDLYYKEEEYKKFDAWWQAEQQPKKLFPLSMEEKAGHLIKILIDNNVESDDAWVLAETIWDLFMSKPFPKNIEYEEEGGKL